MVKKRLKPNLFNDEISRLERVIKKIGDGSTIDSSLKNYFVYRLVGIYEIKVYDTLKRQIDEDNPYKTTYGAAWLKQLEEKNAQAAADKETATTDAEGRGAIGSVDDFFKQREAQFNLYKEKYPDSKAITAGAVKKTLKNLITSVKNVKMKTKVLLKI